MARYHATIYFGKKKPQPQLHVYQLAGAERGGGIWAKQGIYRHVVAGGKAEALGAWGYRNTRRFVAWDSGNEGAHEMWPRKMVFCFKPLYLFHGLSPFLSSFIIFVVKPPQLHVPTIKQRQTMSLLSVTDLINLLFVDVPGDDDGVGGTTEQQRAAIVLPSAGEGNFWPRISACLLLLV